MNVVLDLFNFFLSIIALLFEAHFIVMKSMSIQTIFWVDLVLEEPRIFGENPQKAIIMRIVFIA